MKPIVTLAVSLTAVLCAAPIRAVGDAVYTSTREVTSLAVEQDGTLWVGTTGGVLRFGKEGWRKFTLLDGLPAHETRRVLLQNRVVTAVFPRDSAVWRANRWRPEKTAARSTPATGIREGVLCTAVWRGARYEATLTGLRVREAGKQRTISLPASRGTHISALTQGVPAHGTALWAALFGDGLWAFSGKDWQRVNIDLPAEAREITALAAHGSTLWLGTRRAGVWKYDGQVWKQHLQPNEPFCHNAQALAMYAGRLFVSTLEDGLAIRSAAGWQYESAPELSSVAPRQMAEFLGALYLRHGSGRVDRFDGREWTRDVCAGLPRRQATVIASDRSRLYVAQWGGWSEYDGRSWTHYLKLTDLQGRTLTALYPDGDILWIGTQNRGLGEFDHRTGRLRWHDERQGLPDDWITAITRAGRTLYIGTYVGGLALWDGVKWRAGALSGANVTDFAADGAGGVWIATRTDLWHRDTAGRLTRPDAGAPLRITEIQTLCSVPNGLWVGTRTGLFFLAKEPLHHRQPRIRGTM